jgi:alpha-beta hydrolase superfamily lysophospholipase
VTVRTPGSFTGSAGKAIFTQSWLPDDPADTRGTVVIVHGLGEHSDRYGAVAERLVAEGLAVHACDHQGHGRSAGDRAVVRVDEVVADLDRVVADAATAHADRPLFMLGHSLGGMLAVRYALAHQQRLSGLVLSGPLAAFEAPAAQVALVRAIAAVAPRAGVISLDPTLVSRDPAVVAAYRADPLVHHGRIPARTVAQIAATVPRFSDTVGEIRLATLIVYGTADGLCPPSGSVMLGERIAAADVTVRAYDGLYHEVLNEPERETVLDDVVAWLTARLGDGAVRP